MTPEYKAQVERSFRQLSDAMKPLIEKDAQRIRAAGKALSEAFGRSKLAHRGEVMSREYPCEYVTPKHSETSNLQLAYLLLKGQELVIETRPTVAKHMRWAADRLLETERRPNDEQ